MNFCFMKYKLFSLILILFSYSAIEISGQSKLKEGFVITLENDTLYGFIKDMSQNKNSKYCLFSSEPKSKNFIKYSPLDIKSYRISDEKMYEAKRIFYKDEFNPVFLEMLIEGYVNLYYDHRNKQMAFYLEKEGMPFKGLEMSSIDISPNRAKGYYSDQLDEIKINIYKDTLFSVFDGSPEAYNKIDNLNYEIQDLMDIVKTYISENCKADSCIIFEKDLSR